MGRSLRSGMHNVEWAKPAEVEAHKRAIHGQNHRKCIGTCLWGAWQNPKNHVHSGDVGKPARRKRLAASPKIRRGTKKKEAK